MLLPPTAPFSISVAKPRSKHEFPRPRRALVRSLSECHFPVHSECETPAGPFQRDPRVRHKVAPAQSPPEERRIRETLPLERCSYARLESAPGSLEPGMA